MLDQSSSEIGCKIHRMYMIEVAGGLKYVSKFFPPVLTPSFQQLTDFLRRKHPRWRLSFYRPMFGLCECGDHKKVGND